MLVVQEQLGDAMYIWKLLYCFGLIMWLLLNLKSIWDRLKFNVQSMEQVSIDNRFNTLNIKI